MSYLQDLWFDDICSASDAKLPLVVLPCRQIPDQVRGPEQSTTGSGVARCILKSVSCPGQVFGKILDPCSLIHCPMCMLDCPVSCPIFTCCLLDIPKPMHMTLVARPSALFSSKRLVRISLSSPLASRQAPWVGHLDLVVQDSQCAASQLTADKAILVYCRR